MREGERDLLLGATTGQIYIALMIGVSFGLGIAIWKGNVEMESPENSMDKQQ